jgi:hypothetical protein
MYNFLNDALFPTFRKFTTGDFLPYQLVYKKYYAPYADISPANLLAWFDIDNTLEISRLDDAIVLRYENTFEHNSINYLLLEPKVSKEHVIAIYALAPSLGNCILREQPRALLANLEEDPTFQITSNRASSEYILDVEQHVMVTGGAFYRQRYEVRAFERANQGKKLELRMTVSASNKDKELLKSLLSQWQLTANAANSTKENREREAISRAIASLDETDRPFAILFLDAKPIAFSLFAFYGDVAIVGHVKVDYEYPFVFDYMVHRLAKLFKDHAIKYINFEQDLGIEGLRSHKSRLRPVRMLEKADIMPRLV